MKNVSLLALALLGTQATAHAQQTDAGGQAWPPRYVFGNGTELSATGNIAYDFNDASGDGYNAATTLEDDHDWRRQELGFSLKRKGVYDFAASFDFHAETWMDVALRVETQALFGRDLGKLRAGQFKTPVGFEGNTSTRNSAFMESSLPTQAFYAGRRTGIDWTLERDTTLLNVGYLFGSDLQGNNDGTTLGARAAWTPLKQAGRVLHLGVSGSIERPDSEINGLGVEVFPAARWRAKPEASLTSVRLVDSGTLSFVDSIRRSGVEALWIDGPWSLQAEYLHQRTARDHGLPGYAADGYYVFGSWVLTGESRNYSGGNVGNPKPTHAWGAVELLARYSQIDLDNDGITGGRERNWTLGANWYLTRHVKLQANYVRADAKRGASSADPEIMQLRVQFYF
ncbi:phosphate-selective porin OprO/OprP [Luteimonas cucumeris]|uniref:Phosphate-selective porin OprO/OprP n=2 Tax=Luteimonas cucumeris TaxID=985012 RepID=A0A562L578_9GAMM|nr:porin [Luteimonas cucumeris]TWI02819.1 phosphate-selective porin OprO/OprP [Luteimonas cucumeris]